METIADYAPLVAALKGARHVGVLTGAGVYALGDSRFPWAEGTLCESRCGADFRHRLVRPRSLRLL